MIPQLDTIIKLLAGSPPDPSESLLFQKYIYCKEDHLSWVEDLLSGMGIPYSRVDSLVNGLYEFRINTTNDQFNSLILKVEQSELPILATYKKIDGFSDLIGINVFDMENYAAGCDARISKSDSVSAEAIKYWINVQNDQICQRQLDLAGSASIGTYSIDFTGGNVISGSVPVNGTIRDNILYRKKISGSGFDYTLTNCTIEGWIIDYKKNQNDISNNYTVVTDPGNIAKSYDDDVSTSCDTMTTTSTIYVTAWEVSFSARSISSIHLMHSIVTNYSNTISSILQAKIDDVWTTIFSQSHYGTTEIKYYHHDNTSRNNVTGIRYQVKGPGGGVNNDSKIFDISVLT